MSIDVLTMIGKLQLIVLCTAFLRKDNGLFTKSNRFSLLGTLFAEWESFLLPLLTILLSDRKSFNECIFLFIKSRLHVIILFFINFQHSLLPFKTKLKRGKFSQPTIYKAFQDVYSILYVFSHNLGYWNKLLT